jgi:cobalt-zinc-cadmium resistance protein CzcA
VQNPLALVVVGGMTLAPVLILLVLPVLIDLFSTRGRRTSGPDGATPACDLQEMSA